MSLIIVAPAKQGNTRLPTVLVKGIEEIKSIKSNKSNLLLRYLLSARNHANQTSRGQYKGSEAI